MSKYNCGHCAGRHDTIEQVKACSSESGNIVIEDRAPVAKTLDTKRVVKATCINWTLDQEKWVRNAHTWEGQLSEVKGQKCCPEHRS